MTFLLRIRRMRLKRSAGQLTNADGPSCLPPRQDPRRSKRPTTLPRTQTYGGYRVISGIIGSRWITPSTWLQVGMEQAAPVSYTHLRAHETDSYLVCRLLLE